MRRHKLFRFVNVLILLALIFAPLTSASSRPADELQPEITLDYAPDRLLARLQDGYSPSKTETEALGVQSMQRLFVGQELPAELAQIVEISLFPGSDVHATQAMLAKDPHFVWVEPDYLAYPVGDLGVDVVPNDPLYPA